MLEGSETTAVHLPPSAPANLNLALSVFVLVVLFCFWRPPSERALAKNPLLRDDLGNDQRELEYVRRGRDLYREGYQRFKTSLFRLTTSDETRLVLPMKYLDELRSRPDDEVSVDMAMRIMLESSYTKVPYENLLLTHLVKADLNPKLVEVTLHLGVMVRPLMQAILPECNDWTPVRMQEPLLKIVAMLSGSIFVGPEVSRREEYLHASIMYTVDVFESIRLLKQWRRSFRWIGAYFIPAIKRIGEHHRRVEELLVPIIQERKKMRKSGGQLPDDLLQWMIDKEGNFGVPDDAHMAHKLLVLSMAAIHTTNGTMLNILYDLAGKPELISALRAEVRTALADNDGVYSKQALYDMKLLDSVMKESQRLHPLSFSRFTRVILKDMTLRDGTFIPADTVVEVPNEAISRDPAIFPDPDTFDAYRHLHLRQAGEQHVHRHQFVSVTPENTNFGWGRHACPGRFFAANEIKLILAVLVLRFDFKMKDEDAKLGRFCNWDSGNTSIPDPTKELLLRRVQS